MLDWHVLVIYYCKPSEILQSVRPSIYASFGIEERRTDYNKSRYFAVLLKPVDTLQFQQPLRQK